MDPRLIFFVEEIERYTGQKLEVNSGYRCEKHNRKVGGSKTSSHLKGLAVDLEVDNSRLRFKVVSMAISLGIHRIGISRNFIHLDIERRKDPEVIWLY